MKGNEPFELTKEEESELQLLRLLQADTRRWLSMAEFERISELAQKQAKGMKSPYINTTESEENQ